MTAIAPAARSDDARPAGIPVSEVDFFSDEVILDPYPHYASLRWLGPAVWLTASRVHAVSRYADVEAVLRNRAVFLSGQGVGIEPRRNALPGGTVLVSDPPLHARLRGIINALLLPGALARHAPRIEREAAALVDRLIERGSFDAVADLAQYLPLSIVSTLVGLPEEGRANMLRWAEASFNALGGANPRFEQAMAVRGEIMAYVVRPETHDAIEDAGWAAAVRAARDAGVLTTQEFSSMLFDFIGPSLDTTIFAISNAILLFGRHPEQWRLLCAEPARLTAAISEVLRLESPIRGFTRLMARDHEIGGTMLPAGSRVWALYASANRDERKWPDPDRFDIRRRAADHLAFGVGPHMCVGQHLAKLEMRAILAALARRHVRFAIGEPVRALNNILRGLTHLPVTIER